MPAVINSSTAGDLNPGLDGSGGPVATAIAIVRQTFLSCSLGDAISAQVSYGFDQITGEARVVMPKTNGAIGDAVTVTMGAGNNIQRFSGTLIEFDTTLAPHAVTAVCKGPLYALEQYENGTETISSADGSGRPGLAFEDLVNASSATLQQIIAAVLTVCGVSFSLGNFDDPAHVYGLLAPEEFTWGTHETASQYVSRVLGASAGYRLFESTDGNVYLRQISSLDGIGPEFTLTPGVDILGDGQNITSTINQRTSVLVEGYDFDGTGAATNNPSGLSGTSTYRVSSTLIETDAFATELAAFWLPQVNRLQKVVRLTTPRDDLFGPAQIHFVNAAGGLMVAETMWVKSFTAEVTASGEFTQRPVYVGGA